MFIFSLLNLKLLKTNFKNFMQGGFLLKKKNAHDIKGAAMKKHDREFMLSIN